MRWLNCLRVSSGLLAIAAIATSAVTLRAMDESRRWTSAVSNAIMSYTLAERTLQVDLLTARSGLLRSYDPVNADLIAAGDNLADLRRLPMREPARRVLREITSAAERQEMLVERFKSRNALLQNSLTRFTANGIAEIGDHHVLSAWILKLTLDTSEMTVREARSAVRSLSRAPDRTAAAQLVSHARLLVSVLPEIDRLLNSIRAMHMEERVGRLQTLLRAEATDRADAVRHLQMLFGMVVVLLAATVTAMILRQRQYTRELQAHADNERLSAAIAMPLIDTGHATFTARVAEAVDRLAAHVGAKRLLLMIPGASGPSHFSAPRSDMDRDWFCQVVRTADSNGAWSGDRVVASTRGGGGHPAVIEAMRDAGITDLVLLRTAEPNRVVIGFEPEGAATAQRRDHIAGIASAIVAIAHGARREVLQLERERLERTVARAGRMETIGAMASGVAHNFNNIIGAIGGFAEMGQERTRNGSLARRHFDEISSAVQRARDLVDEILTFAKQGRSCKRAVDLSAIIEEAVQLLSAAERGDEFRLQPPQVGLTVLGAGSELQQVILNICNNAAHAGGGLPVAISAERASLDEHRHLSHGHLAPGEYVTVSISDRGPGIPETAKNRLFEPFFTMKAGGTGLGLSTAWEIVQDHGGTIDVRNLEPGACFTVWLPELPDGQEFAVPGDGTRILLLSQLSQLPAEEELLAELGYEPVGMPLSTNRARLLRVLEDCDAVLAASCNSANVMELVQELAGAVQGRALLVATPEGPLFDCELPTGRLAYPLQRRELTAVLPGLLGNRAAVGVS
jgi:signal transduction histidine kinase